jgi:hypothetical protein
MTAIDSHIDEFLRRTLVAVSKYSQQQWSAPISAYLVPLGKWCGLHVHRPKHFEVVKYSSLSLCLSLCGLARTSL